MPTTTEELVELTRQTLDDVVEPYLVSENRILQALDRSQREFVERTLCLVNPAFPITLIQDNPFTWLDETILRVRSVWIDGEHVPVTSYRDAQNGSVRCDYGFRISQDWVAEDGRPRMAITDMQTDAIRWAPIPDQDYTATMDVYLYPPRMADGEDPAIPQRWRSDLVSGAAAKLFRSRDVEVFDPKASEVWQQQWYTTLAEAYAGTQRSQRGAQTAQFNRGGVW